MLHFWEGNRALKKTKFLRTFEKILNRVCKEYGLDYRTDNAQHGYQYFICREGYPERCIQISGTPRNPRYVGAQVRKDLLQVLQVLGVKNPDVDTLKVSFMTYPVKKTLWEEIDELPNLYNAEVDEL